MTEYELETQGKTLNAANDMAKKISDTLGFFCKVVKITPDPSIAAPQNHRHWTLEVYSSKGNLLLGTVEFQWFSLGGVFKAFHNLCNRDQFKAAIGEPINWRG